MEGKGSRFNAVPVADLPTTLKISPKSIAETAINSMKIVLKSFNGIGDLLYVTPSLKVIKEAYPDSRIVVNTNYPQLLKNNPYVDSVGSANEGLFLAYPDPIHKVLPAKHHILSDWELICNTFNLKTKQPELCPRIYFKQPSRRVGIGVQTHTAGKYHGKKEWPFFQKLVNVTKWTAIGKCNNIVHLTEKIMGHALVVVNAGGLAHIAAATFTPAVVIYGGFDKPAWAGYGFQVNIVNRLDCSDRCYSAWPCHAKEKHKCWRDISVKSVVEVVRALI